MQIKAGATVIWRNDFYMLWKPCFYRKEDSDLIDKNNSLIKSTIDNEIRQGYLPTSVKHLILVDPRWSIFYLLPKIHKDNIPGRPVVSTCSCPCQNLATYHNFSTSSTRLAPFCEAYYSCLEYLRQLHLSRCNSITLHNGCQVSL